MRMRALIALPVLLLLSAAGVMADGVMADGVTADRPAAAPPRAACGIAPWTGTCSCTLAGRRQTMSYADYAALLSHDPQAQALLAQARAACGVAGPRS
jgi:hypothetical protein